MRILLLGKKGLLGQEIVNLFKNSNDEFFAMGHDDLDITDKDALLGVMKDIKPNIVINAAAFTYVDECETKKQFVMEVNGNANGNLAAVCHDLNAYLLYLSTDYVFNGTKKEGYKEDDEPSPINVYGESKLLGEKLIQQNTDKFYIFRTSWLFGMQGRNFVKTMLELANKEKEIKVVDDQFGKPTYSADLAKGIYDFIHKVGGEMPEAGIFHLTNEGTTSWYEFAKNIFEIKGLKVKLIPISSDELSRPARRPTFSILLNTKLPKLRHHKEALQNYINLL
jgi:dTDP-4-dehydrorhamnose reductase